MSRAEYFRLGFNNALIRFFPGQRKRPGELPFQNHRCFEIYKIQIVIASLPAYLIVATHRIVQCHPVTRLVYPSIQTKVNVVCLSKLIEGEFWRKR